MNDTRIRADLVLFADTVHTLLPEAKSTPAPIQAIAISGRSIVALGSRADAATWDTQDAQVIDCGAATIAPGFVDAHVHPLSGAESRFGALQLQSAQTIDDVVRMVAEHASGLGPDDWVRGYGLSFDLFVGREVSNEPFVSAFGGRPGFLLFFDGHSVIASPRGLELAGIDGPRDFGNNASIEVDADGVPTGYLIEGDAEMLVTDLVPRMGFAEQKAAVLAKLHDFAASGYTSLHQMNYERGDAEVLRALEEEGDLPVRVRISPLWRANDPWHETLERMVASQGVGGRRWSIEGVKLMLDGTIDNGSAWLEEADTQGSGTVPYWMPTELFARTVHALAESGIPTATHAIGDRAVEFVLDVIESIPAHAPQVTHRIEHVETIPDSLLPRFAELGVVASMQPMHAFATKNDHSDMWSTRLGRGSVRAKHGWRVADLYRAGATVALGSDWPVEEFDARQVFASNVTRQRPGTDAEPIEPAQALSPEATLRCLTHNAWIAIDRPTNGVLRPGALADLVVFRGDPLRLAPEEFATTPVLLTVVNGAVAHRSAEVR